MLDIRTCPATTGLKDLAECLDAEGEDYVKKMISEGKSPFSSTSLHQISDAMAGYRIWHGSVKADETQRHTDLYTEQHADGSTGQLGEGTRIAPDWENDSTVKAFFTGLKQHGIRLGAMGKICARLFFSYRTIIPVALSKAHILKGAAKCHQYPFNALKIVQLQAQWHVVVLWVEIG